MKIREFIAAGDSGSTQPFRLKLEPPAGPHANCFSILVGANGTRKSRTLRDIVDIVVPGLSRESEFIERKAGRIRLWREAEIPRVIAVSGVATDRFPSRFTSRKSRYTKVSYSYIGPRTDNNLVSRAQAVQQVALAILDDPIALRTRAPQLRGAFSVLKLRPGIYFELEKERMPGRPWSMAMLRDRIEMSKTLLPRQAVDGDLLKRSVQFLKLREVARLRLDLQGRRTLGVDLRNADVMHLLLQAGLLRVTKCHARNAAGKRVDLRELSSGQWHLLSSLVFVAATVKDDTLVLVDEPENSLHPTWQQEYLPLLQQAISSSKGVHVVVSTHSPHVASSLSPDVTEVIALTFGRTRVTAKPLASGPYGWAADDILRMAFGLETTRSRGFSRQVDAALKLFAKGDRKDPALVEKVRALEAIATELPDDDAVREMIQTMAALVRQQATS